MVGEAVVATTGDPTKVPGLPVAVAKVASLGEPLVVAGAGAAVGAAVAEFGARVAAWSVVKTWGTVGVGVALAVAADKKGAPPPLVAAEVCVCSAPSLGRVAAVAAAVGLPLVGTTVVLPASSCLAGCVDAAGEASLDTWLVLGSLSSLLFFSSAAWLAPEEGRLMRKAVGLKMDG